MWGILGPTRFLFQEKGSVLHLRAQASSSSLARPETHSIPYLSVFAKSLQRALHVVMSSERIGKKENTAPHPQGRSITTASGISVKHFWTVTHSKNTFTI